MQCSSVVEVYKKSKVTVGANIDFRLFGTRTGERERKRERESESAAESKKDGKHGPCPADLTSFPRNWQEK
eukprot:114697-Rhodomonas_salina.1